MLWLSIFFLAVAVACAVWIVVDIVRSRRQARRDKTPERGVTNAKTRIDLAAYQAEVDLRRCYTERTGRVVPPPNPFKYG